jgi:multidrug resistance efflux pump
MRVPCWLVMAPVLGLVSGCGRSGGQGGPNQALAGERSPGKVGSDSWEVKGKTQPLPGRLAQIAPVVLHPVEKVYVTAGQWVKKDAKLVEIDADEPKADVRAREAAVKEMEASYQRLLKEPRASEHAEARATLLSAKFNRLAAESHFSRLAPLYRSGAVAEQRFHESKLNRDRTRAEEQAALARLDKLLKRPLVWELNELKARINTARGLLDSAKAELEHYTLTAPISGTISWLDVYPGTVSRPGTSLWGEILDLRQIDVRCDLKSEDADRLAKGQRAKVKSAGRTFAGKVVMIGIAADRRTGKVPVIVRVRKANNRIRCFVPVTVQFGN